MRLQDTLHCDTCQTEQREDILNKKKEGETTRTEGKKQKEVSVHIFASVSGAHEDYKPMTLAIPFTL